MKRFERMMKRVSLGLTISNSYGHMFAQTPQAPQRWHHPRHPLEQDGLPSSGQGDQGTHLDPGGVGSGQTTCGQHLPGCEGRDQPSRFLDIKVWPENET